MLVNLFSRYTPVNVVSHIFKVKKKLALYLYKYNEYFFMYIFRYHEEALNVEVKRRTSRLCNHIEKL